MIYESRPQKLKVSFSLFHLLLFLVCLSGFDFKVKSGSSDISTLGSNEIAKRAEPSIIPDSTRKEFLQPIVLCSASTTGANIKNPTDAPAATNPTARARLLSKYILTIKKHGIMMKAIPKPYKMESDKNRNVIPVAQDEMKRDDAHVTVPMIRDILQPKRSQTFPPRGHKKHPTKKVRDPNKAEKYN